MTVNDEITIAEVAWPVYKLVALAVGALVLVVIAIVFGAAGPAVLGGAAAATATWLALGVAGHRRG